MFLKFTKMHGAGNDFVMLDGISQRLKLRPEDIRRLADRRRGIGCDQVLLVEPPGQPDADFRYRIFNADGSEAGQCGNGARCFARFVRHRKLTAQRRMVVETNSGLMTLKLREQNRVEVDMGPPVFAPELIPLRRDLELPEYELTVAGEVHSIGALSMGNPHAILRVEVLDDDTVGRLGPAMESHEDFPDRVNAGFMVVEARDRISLRVYERGVGETLACGSGACAAVVHGHRMGWLDRKVTVQLPGGTLTVDWPGNGKSVRLTGPTAISFEGGIRL